MRRSPHGSALLTAVIAVLVISVIAAGILRFASRETVGASATAHEQALVACAEAARVQLLSHFHLLGFQPSSITPLKVPLASSTIALGGHYDTAVGNVQIDQVSYLPDNATGPTSTPGDLTGRSSGMGQGGRPVKVVVHCQDGVLGGGRRLEVEFGIRFGL